MVNWTEERIYLYKLEEKDVLKLIRTKSGNEINYQWILTEKGKERILKDSELSNLWKDNEIKKLYEKLFN